jgi:hypothetical protein
MLEDFNTPTIYPDSVTINIVGILGLYQLSPYTLLLNSCKIASLTICPYFNLPVSTYSKAPFSTRKSNKTENPGLVSLNNLKLPFFNSFKSK